MSTLPRASSPNIAKRPEQFRRQLRELPAFRGLLRAVEADFYVDLPMPTPILDLGCGDGHFAEVAFDEQLDLGLDPWWPPLREAHRRDQHRWLTHADGAGMPVAGATFGTVVSNSVLEHIPDVKPVLGEVSRVLKPGGWFHFAVPGPNFRRYLLGGRLLAALGLEKPADAYRALFDRISRHHYYLSPEEWAEALSQAGLHVVRWWSYFSPGALTALELGHPLGLPSLVAKQVTGRWLIAATRWNLAITELMLRRFYEEPVAEEAAGAYLFISAQRD
jgi:SAM-dependent methyltransferase